MLAFIAVTALSPVLLLCGALVDGTLWLRRRKHWMAVRLLVMLWWFLRRRALRALGAARDLATSARRDSARRRERVYRLKRRWLASHLAGIRGLFGMRFESEGLELAGPGPGGRS